MDKKSLSQVSKIISTETQKLTQRSDQQFGKINQQFSKLNRKVDKNHRETLKLFNDLDHRMFYVDQRLTKIEYHLGQPTPAYDPTSPIESVFINTIGR